MKKLTIVLIALVAIVLSAPAAQALSISADIPLQYSFSEGDGADNVSGLKVGLSLPLMIGFGYENYTISNDDSSDYSYNFQLLDIFFQLPIPFINIGLGVGAGVIGTEAPSEYSFETGTASQYFLSLGTDVLPLLDIHLGYHVVNAKVTEKTTNTELDLSGTMISLGATLGF